jgi:hypothetical protein
MSLYVRYLGKAASFEPKNEQPEKRDISNAKKKDNNFLIFRTPLAFGQTAKLHGPSRPTCAHRADPASRFDLGVDLRVALAETRMSTTHVAAQSPFCPGRHAAPPFCTAFDLFAYGKQETALAPDA